MFTQQQATRLSILNGSHTTISEHHDRETILIFPEYRVVFGVENTPKAVELLYEKVVSPSTTYIPSIPEENEAGELPFGILPIPYSCVILLCALSLFDEVLVLAYSPSSLRLPQTTRQSLPRCCSCPRTWCVFYREMNRSTFLRATRAFRVHPFPATTQMDGRHQPRPRSSPRRPPLVEAVH